MKLHPNGKIVLCRLASLDKEEVVENGIVYIKEQVPQYEVVEIGQLENIKLNIGDKLITNSIPTKLHIKDDETYYLIKEEYIAGVLKDE